MKTKEENNSFGKAEKPSKRLEQKPKSAFTLFWEKYPNGYAGGCKIINHEAVLR